MYLINVKAFIEREQVMKDGKAMDGGSNVLQFRDYEATDYAILSHRWIEKEVDYKEMSKLAKMKEQEQKEVRERAGYRKIFASCEQAKRDGYEWLWVDTCCIDKRSSSELSEAINSMYRWYERSRVCYAYLHDVPGMSFPTKHDERTYSKFGGWPEWFSRGWTLQEMIAPSNVQFFNQNWQPIGNKGTLAKTLSHITRVPERILTSGLSSSRPCVAQIMSWASDRTTTRVEDKAYSLLGLLNVNIPMLYGEGKKAFHRLQLEIIRMSNDQSIFAWGFSSPNCRTGSVLADDPSFFRDCGEMEFMDPKAFIKSLKEYMDIPEEEWRLIEEERFGVFPITNRGIQIWLFLCSYVGSSTVFNALLPCRNGPLGLPVSINFAFWKSNYHRYFTSGNETPEDQLQFRQVYLRYQDTPHHDHTFEIDDHAIIASGLTYCGGYPAEPMGNTTILTSTNPLYIKVYSDSQVSHFAVGFGQCFGQGWIHSVYKEHTSISNGPDSWKDYASEQYTEMLVRGPKHAQSMAEMRSGHEHYGHVCVTQTYLPRSTWTMQTSSVTWESSRSGLRIEAFRYPGSGDVSSKWTGFRVGRADDPDHDMRGLMLQDYPEDRMYELLLDGVSTKFLPTPNRIRLGDYGRFGDSGDFEREGNIISDHGALSSGLLRQHKIDEKGGHKEYDNDVKAYKCSRLSNGRDAITLYKPRGESFPRNRDFNSLLASLSTRLTNRYLVTTVIHSEPSRHAVSSTRFPTLDTNNSNIITPLCTIVKPLVWYRDVGGGFERSGDASCRGDSRIKRARMKVGWFS